MISNLINVADIPSSARLKYQAILNSSFSTSFSDFSAFSKTTAREKKSFWGSEITSSKSQLQQVFQTDSVLCAVFPVYSCEELNFSKECLKIN